jgi:hypothetical protein
MQLKSAFTAAAAAVVIAAPAVAVAAAVGGASQPPRAATTADITFVKHLVDSSTFTFRGVTSGAVHGRLKSQLLEQTAPATTEYEFVEFRWTIRAAHRSLVAVTDGTLDKNSGVVAMTGTVTHGWRAGSEVLERGQLIDPKTETFAGDVVLLTRKD